MTKGAEQATTGPKQDPPPPTQLQHPQRTPVVHLPPWASASAAAAPRLLCCYPRTYRPDCEITAHQVTMRPRFQPPRPLPAALQGLRITSL